MASNPTNLFGVPTIPASDFQNADPSRLNRTLQLLAQKIGQVSTVVSAPASTTTTAGAPAALKPGVSAGAGAASGSTSYTFSGTHTQRVTSYPAANYISGVEFYETDRTVWYLDYTAVTTGQYWLWAGGTMRGVITGTDQRPADLGTNDTGFLFFATDLNLTYRWSGSAWVLLSNVEPILEDTHANRLANYPSTRYADGTLFYENDRTVTFINLAASGTVTTAATAVAWVSGDKFNTDGGWPGKTITINAVAYAVASVTNATNLVLTATAGVQVAVAYSVASGKWQYMAGIDYAAQASLPADLGTADAGFLISVTDFIHVLKWSGSAWGFGPGDSRGAFVQAFEIDPSPTTGWILCDGSATTYLNADGTTSAYTTKNLTGNPAYMKLGNAASAITAPTAPTITGPANTGSNTTGLTVGATGNSVTGVTLSDTNVDIGSGTVVMTGVGTTVAAHTHTHTNQAPTDPGHTHTNPAPTDPGHLHTVGSITAGTNGEPQNIVFRPWFRR